MRPTSEVSLRNGSASPREREPSQSVSAITASTQAIPATMMVMTGAFLPAGTNTGLGPGSMVVSGAWRNLNVGNVGALGKFDDDGVVPSLSRIVGG